MQPEQQPQANQPQNMPENQPNPQPEVQVNPAAPAPVAQAQPSPQSQPPVYAEQPQPVAQPVFAQVPLVEQQPTQPEVATGPQPIQWQAPEYVQDRRSPKWFIAFWIVAAVLMAAAFFLLQSISFALLVPAMAAALMIYSHRPPGIMNYVLSDKGIYINEKLHPMAEFRAFGVARDESIPSLVLIPVKRFRPALTLHFPEEIGEALVDFFGQKIPMREIKPDAFDKIIRKLHI